MPQIKMAQRRWKSLSQIFVGPYLISRNENQGSLNFNKQTYIQQTVVCQRILEGGDVKLPVQKADGAVLVVEVNRWKMDGYRCPGEDR
jgi:hypothetical protein